jgi:hypothetical protein
MKSLIAISTLLIGLGANPALAQTGPGGPGQIAREQMMRVADMAGDWTVTVFGQNADGQFAALGEEPSHVHFILNGMALREDAQADSLAGFQIESTLQYDQNRETFRLVSMDDTWGNMDIYEGNFDPAGVLRLTNLRSGTTFVAADGSERHFRLSFTVHDANRNSFSVEMSGDAGQSWNLFQRYDRTRVNPVDN